MTPGERTLVAIAATALFILGLFEWALHGAERRVSIQDVNSGTGIRCTVPKDKDNRWLDMGVEGYFSHGVQLDGDAAPVIHQIQVGALDCEGQDHVVGFCEVFFGVKGYESAVVNLPCRDHVF